MGNDLKYGLILGVVVLLIFVGWMVIHNRGTDGETSTAESSTTSPSSTPAAGTDMWPTSGLTDTATTAGAPAGAPPSNDVALAPTTNVSESPTASYEISRPLDTASVRTQDRTTYSPGPSAPGAGAANTARPPYQTSAASGPRTGDYIRPTDNPPVGLVSLDVPEQTGPVLTEPEPESAAGTHTVASGETLQDISRKYFGTTTRWREIAEANPSVDPNRMKVGTKLTIPGGSSAGESSAASDSPDIARSDRRGGSGKSYTIASGDTLYRIAEKEYGNGNDWRRIYDANRDTLSSPQALKVGTTITIP
jgi:nucleoid-associated protein YgaU